MKFDGHIFYFIEISRRGAMTKQKIFALAAPLAAPLSAFAVEKGGVAAAFSYLATVQAA
jgi:hypothetical protein